MTAACGPPAPRPPPPDLSAGLCVDSDRRSGLPPEAWTGDDAVLTPLAVRTCKVCPCLTECRDFQESLPRSRKASGIIAARRYLPFSHTPTHGTDSTYNDGCRCEPCRQAHAASWRDYQRSRRKPAVTVTAGLATATASAGGVTSLTAWQA